MREILFKAKRVDNGEWIEGYGVCVIPNSNLASILHFQGNNLMNVTGVIPETVCQFTGLIDKNGTKIFEGDVLRKPTKNKWEELNFVSYEVFFHDNDNCESSIGYQMNRHHFHGSACGTDEYFRFIPRNTKIFEVIGNIHDDANKQ